MEKELFDYVKEIIIQEISKLDLAMIFSQKEDFFGIKFAKNDKYFVCFISNYMESLTFTYRDNYYERDVCRRLISRDNLSELHSIIKSVLLKNSEIYQAAKTNENSPQLMNQESEINREHKLSQEQKSACIKEEEKKSKLQIVIDEFDQTIIDLNEVPEDVKNMELSQVACIEMSVRLSNCMARNRIVTVKDFLSLKSSDFIVMRNLGRNTLREANQIRKDLMQVYCNGRAIDHELLENKLHTKIVSKLTRIELRDISQIIDVKHYRFDYSEEDYGRYIAFNNELEELLMLSFEKITSKGTYNRNVEIFKKRIGLIGEENYTLQQVGDGYGLSRERIRQITNRIIRKLKQFKNEFIAKFNELPEEDIMNYFVDGIGSSHGINYINAIFDLIGKKELANSINKSIALIQNTARRINNNNSVENKMLSAIAFPNNVREVLQDEFNQYKVERFVEEHDKSASGEYTLNNGVDVVEYESFLEKRIIAIFDNAYYVDGLKAQSLVIPYEMNGVFHRYYPDLLIHFTNNRMAVVEVKALYEMGTTRSLTKYFALKDYCEKNGFGYLMTDERYHTIESLINVPTSAEFESAFIRFLASYYKVDLKMVQAFFRSQGLYMDLRILTKLVIKYRNSLVYTVRPFCIRYCGE